MSVDQARLESSTITNNLAESLRIADDGERQCLIHTDKTRAVSVVIFMNPKEALVVEMWLKSRRKIRQQGGL